MSDERGEGEELVLFCEIPHNMMITDCCHSVTEKEMIFVIVYVPKCTCVSINLLSLYFT